MGDAERKQGSSLLEVTAGHLDELSRKWQMGLAIPALNKIIAQFCDHIGKFVLVHIAMFFC